MVPPATPPTMLPALVWNSTKRPSADIECAVLATTLPLGNPPP